VNGLLQSIARRLGIRGLDLESSLSVGDRDRMILVSVLPAVSIILLFVALAMDIGFDSRSFDFNNPPDEWATRIDNAATYAATFLSRLAVAVMFLAGVRPATRQLGSWATVFAGALLVAAVSSAAFVVFVYLDTSANALAFDRYYLFTWEELATMTGFMAVGYTFLAYRGLSAPEPGRRINERRRRDAA
jgi:hypothetical protein